MQTSQLVRRNLAYYWRTNLAVVLGVATAVAVLAGALLVGDSVRASLRDLFLQRLGNTSYVITAPGFFREQLAADIQSDQQFTNAGFAAACPLIVLEGTVSHETSKRRGSGIRVYGVDERFWKFHGLATSAPVNREVLLSESLANELGAGAGDSLVVRVQKLSDVPIESLHSRKEDFGSTLRLTVRQILTADGLGEFSIQPQQTGVRAVFVPLRLLQEQINQPAKANLILLSETSQNHSALPADTVNTNLGRILKGRASLEDYGIKLRVVGDPQSISVEHDSRLLSDSLSVTVSKAAPESWQELRLLSYLANKISFGERSIPYSLVTGIEDKDEYPGRFYPTLKDSGEKLFPALADGRVDSMLRDPSGESTSAFFPLVLNDWAAQDLGVRRGDAVSLEYYLWHEGGRLETKSERFLVKGILPMEGIAVDRDLVPDYPGISGTENLADWDPPFPVDLTQIRKKDEDYWDKYRSAPKAFLPLGAGQALWKSRFGNLTSIRLIPDNKTSIETALADYEHKLTTALDPQAAGFTVIPVRAQGLEASRGATDFGEYFLYFSFFLVVSALLLTALFFKLGVEQRVREIGVLQAMGFALSQLRKIFLSEGIILAVIGSALGVAGGLAYAQLIMLGLRTWWVDAVGTTSLALHISPLSLLLGAVGGILAALICVFLTLRQLGKASTRSLLTGVLETRDTASWGRGDSRTTSPRRRVPGSPRLLIAVAFTLLGLVFLLLASFQVIGQTPGFFGGGLLLLVALLCFQSVWLRRGNARSILGTGWWPLSRLGFRNATSRPGRSVLCIALIASASFIIVAVDAFRHREGTVVLDQKSGSGGFPLMAESLLPIVHDLNTDAGKDALNITADAASSLAGIRFERFRVRPGDDASCLNLYQPRNPKIIAPRGDFVQSGRFAFASSIASTNEEKTNPWWLLNREFGDGAIPFIADANSATYVLHVKLGEDLILPAGERLRLVGTLANSVLQSELIISETNFLRLFPEQEGCRLFLIDAPANKSAAVAASLEERLSDFGLDVVPTSERLANFHRVENTYLSTFQMLGGLGLVLGTLGMGAVLLRNVLERRQELALLRAVGYNSRHFALMAIAENAFLLVCGIVTGVVCALLAIAPVFFERGGRVPGPSLGFLLMAVLVSGLTASVVATWATLKSPLLPALRAE